MYRAPDVLNAFRHHGLYRAIDMILALDAEVLVLNAFRHHGLYRPSISQIQPRYSAQRLSASRIISAVSIASRICRSVGAQRLSASRIISVLLESRRRFEWIRCSTPFGITDYIGSGPGARPLSATCGAQRLSASRIISAYRLRRHRPRVRSAQRLSASRIISGRSAAHDL